METYVYGPMSLNAICEDATSKKGFALGDTPKLESKKEPQQVPKCTPRSDLIDLDCWNKLCIEYKDLFNEPDTIVEWEIKHWIDLLTPNAPIKYHKQYRILQQ